MGLDMYLYLEKYESVSCYSKNFSEKVKNFYPKELKELQEGIQERNYLSKTTKYQVGYWRKANAIHKWFVDNCAGGEDNCKPVYVDIEKLKMLLDICKAVSKDHNKAEKLLPTQDGFFFGGLKYDDWYFEDLDYTIKLFEKVIAFIKEEKKKKFWWDIIYRASW